MWQLSEEKQQDTGNNGSDLVFFFRTVIYSHTSADEEQSNFATGRIIFVPWAAALIRWSREFHLYRDHLSPRVTSLVSGCALTEKGSIIVTAIVSSSALWTE